jgi:hypothetical protein
VIALIERGHALQGRSFSKTVLRACRRWRSTRAQVALTRIADALEPIGFSVFPVPWVSKEGASHVCWDCMRVQARMLWMRVPRRGTRRPTSPRSCAAKAGPQRVRVRCAQNDVCGQYVSVSLGGLSH